MLEEIAEVLGLHMQRALRCHATMMSMVADMSVVVKKALEPCMNFPADDRNPHSVRYAQIQKRDCEVISSAGIERPGESERALTCIASESAGQEDAQRARIVLPEGTDVPSPSWPAGLAGRHSFAALSTACLRGPIRKHQGVVRFASS